MKLQNRKFLGVFIVMIVLSFFGSMAFMLFSNPVGLLFNSIELLLGVAIIIFIGREMVKSLKWFFQ